MRVSVYKAGFEFIAEISAINPQPCGVTGKTFHDGYVVDNVECEVDDPDEVAEMLWTFFSKPDPSSCFSQATMGRMAEEMSNEPIRTRICRLALDRFRPTQEEFEMALSDA